MILSISDTHHENTTASGGTIPRLNLPAAHPAASVAGRDPGALIESALRFAGFVIQRHPSGYHAIVKG